MKNYGPILAAVVIGLTAWGLFHTVGAYQGAEPGDRNIFRSLVVASTFALFMGFWGLMLWLRSARLHQKKQDREQKRELHVPPRL